MNTTILLAYLIFAFVYALIIFRRFAGINISIWMSMLAGAVLMMLIGIVKPERAYGMINFDVIIFLFGMFVIISAMEKSGLLQMITLKILYRSKTSDSLLAMIMVSTSALSAILVNDAIALMATPIVISVCRSAKLNVKPFLIAMAFSVTIGSALTPIGNPQNLLIKTASGIEYLTFVAYMIIPVLFSLISTFFIIKIFHKDEMNGKELSPANGNGTLTDRYLARLAAIAIIFVTLMFLFSDLFGLRLSTIALLGSFIILVPYKFRHDIIRKVDWQILIFFAAMFVVIGGLEDSGAVEFILKNFFMSATSQSGLIVSTSIGGFLLSQIFSNVPFVAIMIPVLKGLNASHIVWMALSASSTLAGNLTIFGAASNIIIVESAESRGIKITSWDFFMTGIFVTILNAIIVISFFIFL